MSDKPPNFRVEDGRVAFDGVAFEGVAIFGVAIFGVAIFGGLEVDDDRCEQTGPGKGTPGVADVGASFERRLVACENGEDMVKELSRKTVYCHRPSPRRQVVQAPDTWRLAL